MPRGVAKKPAAKTVPKESTSADSLMLKAVIDSIEAKHGKGAIVRQGLTDFSSLERLAFDHFDLDDIFGGGLPFGRIIEIYGKPSGAKTTLSLEAIAQAQKQGLRAAFVDVEQSLDLTYAKELGVNIDELLFSQPDNAEQTLDIVNMLAKSNEVNVIVVDSVAALITKAELEGDVGDAHVGRLARLMSQELPRLIHSVGKAKKCIVIFINQERNKIPQGGMGPTKGTKGGESLPFFASIRVDVSRKEMLYKTVKGDKVPIGQISIVKNPKNKVGIPHKKCEIRIDYRVDGQRPGLNRIAPIVDRALDAGVLKKSGTWYKLGDENIAQGEQKLFERLSSDSKLLKEISSKL